MGARRLRQSCLIACLTATILGLGTSAIRFAYACSTPVHRYAMYNWKPTDYRVIYIADGATAEKDRATNAALEKLAARAASSARAHAI